MFNNPGDNLLVDAVFSCEMLVIVCCSDVTGRKCYRHCSYSGVYIKKFNDLTHVIVTFVKQNKIEQVLTVSAPSWGQPWPEG